MKKYDADFTGDNLKEAVEKTSFIGTLTNLLTTVKTDLVNAINEIVAKISNIDNTSDLNKPISTATQTALDSIIKHITITDFDELDEIIDDGPYKITDSNGNIIYLTVYKIVGDPTRIIQIFGMGETLTFRYTTDDGATWVHKSVITNDLIFDNNNKILSVLPDYTTITDPEIGRQGWNTLLNLPVWYNGTRWHILETSSISEIGYTLVMRNEYGDVYATWIDAEAVRTEHLSSLNGLTVGDVVSIDGDGIAKTAKDYSDNGTIASRFAGIPTTFWYGTQAEYDALTEIDTNGFYAISG